MAKTKLSFPSELLVHCLSALLTVLLTSIPLLLIGRATLGEAVIALVYLVPVSWSTARWGQAAGICAAFAAALLARMSGDRERDIDVALRQRVIEALRAGKAPESWVGMVTEYQALSEADEQRLFGEALPPGLKLLG